MTSARLPLKPADAAAVAEFADKVRRALGSDVLDLRLFGSKATGQESPDTDIDILVVVEEARADVEDRILAIAFDVNLAHDVYISPRVEQTEGFVVTGILRDVRRHGGHAYGSGEDPGEEGATRLGIRRRC